MLLLRYHKHQRTMTLQSWLLFLFVDFYGANDNLQRATLTFVIYVESIRPQVLCCGVHSATPNPTKYWIMVYLDYQEPCWVITRLFTQYSPLDRDTLYCRNSTFHIKETPANLWYILRSCYYHPSTPLELSDSVVLQEVSEASLQFLPLLLC